MLTAVAVCPSTPLLLPGVGGRARPEAEVLGHARASVEVLVAGDGDVVVLGTGADAGPEAVVATGRFGATGTRESGPPLALSMAVGVSLLREVGRASGIHLLPLASADEVDAAVARIRAMSVGRDVRILVVGSASACTAENAPGGLRTDAADFNTAVSAAVRAWDRDSLSAVPADTFALHRSDLRWPLVTALEACANHPARTTRFWAGAPFGVHYVCSAATLDT